MLILTTILTFSALLIVPVIIFALAFSMCFYILADDLSMSSTTPIGLSWRLTNRNKYKLFCLQFSFIGWLVLTVSLAFGLAITLNNLTLFIPDLRLLISIFSLFISALVFLPFLAYNTTTTAIFYEMLSGRVPPGPDYVPLIGPGQY
jgi:uncharacterized membrane protein